MGDDQTFRTLLLIGVAMTLPITAYHRYKAHTNEPLDRRKEGWFVLATVRPIGIAFMIALIVYAVNPARMAWAAVPLPGWIRWAGFGVLIAANVLLFWTLHTLGRNLTDTVVTRKAATLVTRGPYRWVRHPFYDAVALLLASVSLITANAFLFLCGTVVLALIWIRTRKEEELLLARFGNQYRAYMIRTGRFFPKP